MLGEAKRCTPGCADENGKSQATAEKMVEIINQVKDEEERRLCTIALMSDKECLEMIQQLIGNDT